MSKKIPFVNFGAQYEAHKDEYDEAIHRCLSNGKLILQEDVEEFEENLASFLGMKYAVAINSGTDALTIALKILDAKMHYKLTTSGYTFKATMEAIHYAGSHPEIVDIDESRLAHNVQVPVHIEGMVAKSDNAILEDACQAIGAEGVGYSGTACYSFYPAKILGGFGDGGAIVTDKKEVAEEARLYRHHWQTGENERFAYCARLDNMSAAFLNVKLGYLEEILSRRKEIAEMYLDGLKEVGLPFNQHGRVWQDFVIEIDEPKKLEQHLAAYKIETLGVGMVPPHKAFNTADNLSNTERLYDRMLRLPCNETLSDADVEEVIDRVNEWSIHLQ